MNPWVAGSVTATSASYCTGAATCTATYPGSCDLLCEDFSGSAECVSGGSYDENCRLENRWSTTLGTGGAVDFTTSHSGTFGCADKGSNAVKITTQAGNSTHIIDISFSTNDVYIEFYFNINSLTLADTKKQGIMTAYYTGVHALFGISILRSGENYVLYVKDSSGNLGTGSTSLSIDGSTWYRIGISAKQSTDALTVYLNGSQEISITNYTATGAFIGPAFGTGGDSGREGNSIVQYDNISISSSALPGGCNQ